MESEEQKTHLLDTRLARPFAAISLHPLSATLDTQTKQVSQIVPSLAKSKRFWGRCLRCLLLQPEVEVHLLASDPPP